MTWAAEEKKVLRRNKDLSIIAIVRHIRPQDVLDILFITIVVYYLYIWFHSTKAFKALIGLLALGIIFTAAQTWGLFLTTWMFQILWQVVIILLIILFQPEIRQFLERFNPFQRLSWRKSSNPAVWVETLTEACFKLAKNRIGALIIIERSDWVDEWITGGIPLEGQPTPEIIMSVFQKESPLHDGAMINAREELLRPHAIFR
jgi:DNA integrity scanning protein DisA with diadenylate cyclase activity